MANENENAAQSNAVESGIDTSRPAAGVVPDRLLIGGKRDGAPPARRAAAPAAAVKAPAAEAEPGDEIPGEVDATEPGDELPPTGEAPAAGAADDETVGELTDEDLIDVLLQSGLPAAPAERGAPAAKTEADLEPGLRAEYDATVDKYGVDMAKIVLLPRLLREQAMQSQMAPMLRAHAEQLEQAQQRAQQECIGFFKAQAAAGYVQVYGDGPDKCSPVQKEAMMRVLAKAAQIKEQVEANGLRITPTKALERAHNALWSSSSIGKAVAARQATMQQRANQTVLPTNRNAAGAAATVPASADPYAKMRSALRKAGFARAQQ